MGSFLEQRIKKYTKDIKLAIETGTFKGDGTKKMSTMFDKVITIELDEQLYNQTKKQLINEGYTNIDFLNGDSGEIIENLVSNLSSPALFFLDAHWSGDSTINWDKSQWKGYDTDTAHLGTKNNIPTSREQVPLDREIKAIAKLYKNNGVIYIDDLDKFSLSGKGLKNKAFLGEDYSHLDLKSFRKDLGYRLVKWKNIGYKQLIIVIDKIPKNYKEKIFQILYYYCVFKVDYSIRLLKNLIRRFYNFI